MSFDLTGKTVLFFGPETFGYEIEIVKELERLGGRVTFRSDKPGKSFLLKALIRLSPRLLWKYSDRIFRKWLGTHAPTRCDVVLVIKGEGLSPRFIDELRHRYSGACFIFYLWDSIKNVKHSEQKLNKFDHAFSFDAQDCRQYPALKYRPLFFLDRFLPQSDQAGDGCFFIGTLNGDRPAVISRVLRALPSGTAFNYWLFVRSNIELLLRRIFDQSMASLESDRLLKIPMPSAIVSQNFQASAVILDIEHPNQFGLTMRTFEVLASGKKLITTNESIASHDFYSPDRICIIDRESPNIPASFFERKADALPQAFFERNSLRGWMSELLVCCNAVNRN